MSDGNSALPEGWEWAKLGELGAFINGDRGKNYPNKSALLAKGIPFINAGHLEGGRIDSATMAYISEERFNLLGSGKVQPDDILYCLRGSLGKTAIVKDIDRAEQRRIVSKIESLQERSSRARVALSEVGPLLAQFRQSVLRAAFSGRLTADWRATHRDVEPAAELLSRIRTERRRRWERSELSKYEAKGKQPPQNWKDKYKEPEPVDEADLEQLPDGWLWSDFDELALIDGGLTRHKEKRSKATEIVPLISVAAVQHGFIDSSQVSEIGLLPTDGDKATLEVGDLLVVEGNGSLEHIGRAALWDGSIPDVRHQNHLIRVRPTLVDPRYALHWLASPLGRRNLIEEATSAAGLYNLSLAKVGRIRIPLAPLEEQAEIVRLVGEVRDTFRAMSELRAESESALTQLDQSILAKAFRGELVPQDSRDEPASELLARIRTTRDAHNGGKPSRKKVTRKRKANTDG